ncbi:MAG: HD domain-containing protein [Nanoarchaeota archaeon]
MDKSYIKSVMLKASESAILIQAKKLLKLLSEEESLIFNEVQKLKFSEGSWFRPIHNIVVPLNMISIIKNESLNRKILLPTAMLHDIGYSKLRLKGNDWTRSDIRMKHSILGAKMAENILRETGSFDKKEIELIISLVKTHDNPYRGIPLKTALEKQHRDSDRSFVPFILSFYKDFINLDSAETLKEFLKKRIISLGMKPGKGYSEPFNTKTGKEIGSYLMNRRIEEIESGFLKNFNNQFEKRMDEEFIYLFSLAK